MIYRLDLASTYISTYHFVFQDKWRNLGCNASNSQSSSRRHTGSRYVFIFKMYFLQYT
ncbi:hypothetical protein Hanom_Chr14g01327241 [Helianthus anomalus]